MRLGPKRSLIICEGISDLPNITDKGKEFPHYMWGYIATPAQLDDYMDVPSLYVRVYRAVTSLQYIKSSSLIICEGISSVSSCRTGAEAFPHYMWGYIAILWTALQNASVPSLYVRVYRRMRLEKTETQCSLIICEGISLKYGREISEKEFPHYMWGYIGGYEDKSKTPAVPSLYVRVYRHPIPGQSLQAGSLIICEGISERSETGLTQTEFPHYMWGYIG